MKNELLDNMDRIHTTKLGDERIRKNLDLKTNDSVLHCKHLINEAEKIVSKGKNWYIYTKGTVITVNMYTYTIITAHKRTYRLESKENK